MRPVLSLLRNPSKAIDFRIVPLVAERAIVDGCESVWCLMCDSFAHIIALVNELVLRRPCPVTAARVVGPQVFTYSPVLRPATAVPWPEYVRSRHDG